MIYPRNVLLLLGIIFYLQVSHEAISQHKASITPLHSFFQDHYDSSVVLHIGSSWNDSPHYLIIAKQKDNFNFFTYTSPYRGLAGMPLPGDIAKRVSKEESIFERTLPDTNRYLLPKRVPSATLKQGWQRLNNIRWWSMEGEKTVTGTKECGIDDGGQNTFFFINKSGIKVAYFYAPDFWEECLGKDPDRQRAIKTRVILQEILNKMVVY